MSLAEQPIGSLTRLMSTAFYEAVIAYEGERRREMENEDVQRDVMNAIRARLATEAGLTSSRVVIEPFWLDGDTVNGVVRLCPTDDIALAVLCCIRVCGTVPVAA